MGQGAVVEYAVAFGKVFHVVADLHLEPSAYDEVEFLAGVLGGMYGLVLKLFAVLVGDVIGLCKLVHEHGRHVLDLDAFLFCCVLSVALAGDRVGGEEGAAAFQKVAHAEVECQGAFVDECERKIDNGGFVLFVQFFAYLGLFRHLGHCITHDLAHFPYTLSYLFKIAVLLCCHLYAPLVLRAFA